MKWFTKTPGTIFYLLGIILLLYAYEENSEIGIDMDEIDKSLQKYTRTPISCHKLSNLSVGK